MLPSEMSMLTSTLTLSHNVPNALRTTRYFERDRISVLLSVAGSGLPHPRVFFLSLDPRRLQNGALATEIERERDIRIFSKLSDFFEILNIKFMTILFC